MAARQASPCLRCGDMIEVNEAALVADFRLRTVGMEDGMRSPQASVSICCTCTDLMAKGDEPPQRTRPLDHLVYQLVQELVANDLTMTFLSWVELRKSRGLSVPTFAEPKMLKAFNDFRKAMALPTLLQQSETEILPPSPAKRLKEAS